MLSQACYQSIPTSEIQIPVHKGAGALLPVLPRRASDHIVRRETSASTEVGVRGAFSDQILVRHPCGANRPHVLFARDHVGRSSLKRDHWRDQNRGEADLRIGFTKRGHDECWLCPASGHEEGRQEPRYSCCGFSVESMESVEPVARAH
jgi:hypothetical protein